ncbi:MAG: hypothetical protein AAGK05_10975 [Pseudomonadota bacterium]
MRNISTLTLYLSMKQGKLKRFLIDSKRKDDVKACYTLERDPDRFVYAEAKAAAAILSKREEKQKPKKVVDRAQTDVTPVNIENLKKKWGKWYLNSYTGVRKTEEFAHWCAKNGNREFAHWCAKNDNFRSCANSHIGVRKKRTMGRVEHQKLNQVGAYAPTWLSFWCSTRLLMPEKKCSS